MFINKAVYFSMLSDPSKYALNIDESFMCFQQYSATMRGVDRNRPGRRNQPQVLLQQSSYMVVS